MNNESFDDLLNRLNNQEKQQVIEYAYMYDDLRYLREHGRYLQKQLEAYENMRKEANNYIEKHIKYETDDCINGMQFCSYHLYDFSKEDLLNILNKVGGSDE